jgi:hypothetical protein
MCGELLARRPAFERRRHAHTHTHTHKLKEYITTSTRKQDKKKRGEIYKWTGERLHIVVVEQHT